MKKSAAGEKIVTTMRIPPNIIKALDKAAEFDNRTRTSMFLWIVTEWLRENGYLK